MGPPELVVHLVVELAAVPTQALSAFNGHLFTINMIMIMLIVLMTMTMMMMMIIPPRTSCSS
jgi:hypothetical protein